MTESIARLNASLTGRYRIERELGEGGMARVYLAEDLRHERKVALKVLRPELAAVVGTDRFLAEIKTTANLHHPHILPLHDSGDADGLPFYVMPFVDGESLGARMSRVGRLSPGEARRILREVADALAHAHEQGVVHRDVKPANVMLSGRHALVADFGVAKALGRVTGGVTATGTAIGTPTYMAPEQAVAERNVDHRADIYALGVLGYEVLTGRSPFAGSTFEAVLAEKIQGRFDAIDPERDEVPRELAEVVNRCLLPDPDERWQSANDVLAVLEALETPAGGTPSGAGPRGRPHVGRTAAVGTLAVVVTVLAGLGIARWMEQRAARERAITEGLPAARAAVGSGDVAGAFQQAVALRDVLGDDPELTLFLEELTFEARLATEPAGARVSWRPYGSGPEAWIPLGTTPVSVRLPRTYSDLLFELDGHEPKLWSDEWYYFGTDTPLRLAAAGSVPEGMVEVDGGDIFLEAPGLEGVAPVRLARYYLDRTEVTNREFKEFVDAGGYETAEWWADALAVADVVEPWDEVVQRFTDRTGLPGPSTWEAGDFPQDTEEHPVLGVSWLEAMAYARFAGKELPTIFHWNHALSAAGTNLIAPRSVLGATGARAVGASGAYGRFGNYDMGGNAREWTFNEFEGRRYILGGGWNDARFMFNDAYAQSPWDRSATNGFRLAIYTDSLGLDEARRSIERPFRDFRALTPVSDEVFDAFRSFYAYDRTALDADVVAVDSARSWIRERVRYEAGYEGPQGYLYLFLPRAGTPPYQTVVLFPGSGPIFTDSMDDDFTQVWDFVVKTGRAVLYPVYWSTFERRDGLTTDQPDSTTEYRERVVRWSRDMRRSIDYAETRPDLDTDQLGFYGFSWGGRLGPLMIALEPRIDAGVLYVAGLKFQETLPEADPFHFAPRVTVPMLMLSGRLDHFFPLETSARPLFELLGSPVDQKRHVIEDGGHSVPQDKLIAETLGWYDRHLGPVR